MVVFGVRLIPLLLVLAGTVLTRVAFAATLTSIALSFGSTGTVAELTIDGHTSFKSMSLSRPNRLVVDLPETRPGQALKIPSGQGVIHSVRLGQPSAHTLRIVFDLATSVVAFSPQMQVAGNQSSLWIQWPSEKLADEDTNVPPADQPLAKEPGVPSFGPILNLHQTMVLLQPQGPNLKHPGQHEPATLPGAATDQPLAAQPTAATAEASAASGSALAPDTAQSAGSAAILATAQRQEAKQITAERSRASQADSRSASSHRHSVLPGTSVKWTKALRPLIVAIDPGHGGQDSGAIGPRGRREKDVTLAIGTELARLIRATPGMKPLMTRTTDVFIPLPQRAQIARAAKADLFISIHADSTDNHVAHGASVYVLSTKGASSQRARWIADKENAADLLGGGPLPRAGTTLANVLLDLAQSGHMKASEDAALEVLGSLKQVGNTHKSDLERANFVVLRTADMPAMLVETAFISNPLEEKRLGQAWYQHGIAVAIRDGIIEFFNRQPPPGTLFAARAHPTSDHPVSAMVGSRP